MTTQNTTMTRVLGRSGIEVSALGMGCWAIGGPFADPKGTPLGWGEVDDVESTRAVHAALDHGITFFDTADVYGTGRSERVLGQALAGRRDDVVLATKWGNLHDERTKVLFGEDGSPEYVTRAVEGSLRRLGTDHLDLYQLHINVLPIDEAAPLIDALEALVDAGKIRWYGWSTDSPERAASWVGAPHFTAVQHDFSVLNDAAATLAVCEENDLASIDRGPLGMGLLTGRYSATSRMGADDVRAANMSWLPTFRDGSPTPETMAQIDAVREILTSDGRTLAQGALGWIWGRSEVTVPIPGCRTVAQVEENAGAMSLGPLTADQVDEVQRLLRT